MEIGAGVFPPTKIFWGEINPKSIKFRTIGFRLNKDKIFNI